MENDRNHIIVNFLDYLMNVRHYSEHTIRSYSIDLDDFSIFCKNHVDKEFKKIKKSNIQAYLRYLSKRGLSAKTVARRLASIKSLYKFLLKNNIVDTNIALSLKTPIIPKKLPHYLSLEEARKILTLPVGENEAAIRDRLVLELFYATGVRISELVMITFKDIRFEEGFINVMGKGDKGRFVIIGKKVRRTLKKYIKLLVDRDMYGEDLFLFPALRKNKNGIRGHISQRTIFNIVKKYMRKVSDDEKLSPHSLRHTFATHMLNNGADIIAIKDLLGHSSLSSTQVYTHLQPSKLKKVYKQAHPYGK
ncbi:MAG: tyrosine-type recombinase/integrase [Candidatus Neomarinimicrobiota bacterium]|nr:tyrosine-type recombinase/integrase [Candidatus Neomarinimicrobiota bacterium]|tara:strand:+ start:78 stop:995 length:918 start_codon:yes stop_codon:yes gene_type:complete